MRLNWKCSTHQWRVLQVCVEGKLGVQGLALRGGSGAELLLKLQPGPGCCQRAWCCCPEPQRGAEGAHRFLSHLPPAQLNEKEREGLPQGELLTRGLRAGSSHLAGAGLQPAPLPPSGSRLLTPLCWGVGVLPGRSGCRRSRPTVHFLWRDSEGFSQLKAMLQGAAAHAGFNVVPVQWSRGGAGSLLAS